MLGAGAAFSTVMTTFRFTGGLAGPGENLDEDEVERREAAKKVRRRPLSETIEQLGEGRGASHMGCAVWHYSDMYRYLRTRLGREAATEAPGEVRRRCKGGTGGGLDGCLFGVMGDTPMSSVQARMYIYQSHGMTIVVTAYLCLSHGGDARLGALTPGAARIRDRSRGLRRH